MTLRRCFASLQTHVKSKQRLQASFEEVRMNVETRRVQKAFVSWFAYYQQRQSLRETMTSMHVSRDFRVKMTVMRVLLNNARVKQSRRARNDLVRLFRRQNLMRRTIRSFEVAKKLGESKHAYSKKFSVFTAWKSLTKENRLLNKYLRECNFQQRTKSSYADLSSIVRNDIDEETKDVFDSGQLSFADHSRSRREPEVERKDINYLYGCKQTASVDGQEQDEF